MHRHTTYVQLNNFFELLKKSIFPLLSSLYFGHLVQHLKHGHANYAGASTPESHRQILILTVGGAYLRGCLLKLTQSLSTDGGWKFQQGIVLANGCACTYQQATYQSRTTSSLDKVDRPFHVKYVMNR